MVGGLWICEYGTPTGMGLSPAQAWRNMWTWDFFDTPKRSGFRVGPTEFSFY